MHDKKNAATISNVSENPKIVILYNVKVKLHQLFVNDELSSTGKPNSLLSSLLLPLHLNFVLALYSCCVNKRKKTLFAIAEKSVSSGQVVNVGQSETFPGRSPVLYKLLGTAILASRYAGETIDLDQLRSCCHFYNVA